LDAKTPSYFDFRGGMHLARREYAEAERDFREAVRLSPEDFEAHNSLAWLLATCRDGAYRNGAEAVRLATTACRLTKEPDAQLLDTLAAALAEAGRFVEAVEIQKQAIELAAPKLKSELEPRLNLYLAGKPFREE